MIILKIKIQTLGNFNFQKKSSNNKFYIYNKLLLEFYIKKKFH